MSTRAPIQEPTAADPASRVPPDEQFWKHYSPHGEAPLSLVGSFTLHAMVVGGMLLFAFYLASLFYKPQRSLPIEPVRLVTSGGGGSRGGTAGGGKGAGQAAENVGDQANANDSQPGAEEAPPRPSLTQVETTALNVKFDPADVRIIARSETGKALARLDEGVRRKLHDGLASSKGQGGSGKDGGKGAGTGTGEGDGNGPGKATLTKRERRMLRWHMRFTANNGLEYLAQLRALGAILAFPVTDGADPHYKVVRDLRPGKGQLIDEDLSKIKRIYWIDDNPRSVVDILAALGVRLPRIPARVVAFMPEELEQKLFSMERGYVERVLKQRFDEDRIEETQFRVVPTPAGYRPELISVSVR